MSRTLIIRIMLVLPINNTGREGIKLLILLYSIDRDRKYRMLSMRRMSRNFGSGFIRNLEVCIKTP
jgi:hypothetical protein